VSNKPKKEIKQSRARQTETIKFLTFDETKRLFENITSKREKRTKQKLGGKFQ